VDESAEGNTLTRRARKLGGHLRLLVGLDSSFTRAENWKPGSSALPRRSLRRGLLEITILSYVIEIAAVALGHLGATIRTSLKGGSRLRGPMTFDMPMLALKLVGKVAAVISC
jgi:hypothetical protein